MASEIEDETVQQAINDYLTTTDRPAVLCDGSCQGFCDEHAEPEEAVYTQAQMDVAIAAERESVWAKAIELVRNTNETLYDHRGNVPKTEEEVKNNLSDEDQGLSSGSTESERQSTRVYSTEEIEVLNASGNIRPWGTTAQDIISQLLERIKELEESLGGMVAAFDGEGYGDTSIVETTRECALSVAIQTLGWDRKQDANTSVSDGTA